MLGPVFWMEMRSSGRRARHYLNRSFFVSAILLVVTLARLNFVSSNAMWGWGRSTLQPSDFAKLGEEIFSAYAIAQFLMVLVLAPLHTAGAIAADRERGVLDLLFASRLRDHELLASKLLVRMIHLSSLVVGGMPVMFICLILGGLNPTSLLITIAITLTMIFFTANFGLFISLICRRVITALIATYMAGCMLWLAIPAIAAVLSQSKPQPPIVGLIAATHPVVGLLSAISSVSIPTPFTSPHLFIIQLYGGLGILLMTINWLGLRRLAHWASRPSVPRTKTKKKHNKKPRNPRPVWDNPVAWREVQGTAVHHRVRWVRLLSLLMLTIVTSFMWLTWLADWIDGKTPLSPDTHGLQVVCGTTAVISWILTGLIGSISFSHERDHSTLDALMTTPMTGRYIVIGKFLGILRGSAFAVAFPLFLLVTGWLRGTTTLRGSFLASGVLLSFWVLAGIIGLICSMARIQTVRAAGIVVTIILVLGGAIPLLDEFFVKYATKHHYMTIRQASPTLSLVLALYDEGGDTYDYLDYYQNWETRSAATWGYIALHITLTAALFWRSIWLMENRYRAGLTAFPAEAANEQSVKRILARKQQRWRIIVRGSLLLMLLGVVGSALAYFQFSNRVATEHRSIRRAISKRGHPIKLMDLAPNRSERRGEGSVALDLAIGSSGSNVASPALVEEMDPQKIAISQLDLQRNRQALDHLERAISGGRARIQLNYEVESPHALDFSPVQHLQQLSATLQHELVIAYHANDSEWMTLTIEQQLGLSDILAGELLTMLKYYRHHFISNACEMIRFAIQSDSLEPEHCIRIERALQKTLDLDNANLVIQGERASMLTALENGLIYNDSYFYEGQTSMRQMMLTTGLGRPWLMRECNLMLRMLDELESAMSKFGPNGREQIDSVKTLLGLDDSTNAGLYYHNILHLYNWSIVNLDRLLNSIWALRAHRYRMAEGTLPTSVKQLAESENLPVPRDHDRFEPVQIRITDEGQKFSIGSVKDESEVDEWLKSTIEIKYSEPKIETLGP